MSNTDLPIGLNTGNIEHIHHHNIIHEELNRITRDTGWRDASGHLINGWKLGATNSWIRIRRINDFVYFSVRSLDGSDATSDVFMTHGSDDGQNISNRFMPPAWSYRSAPQVDDNGDIWTLQIQSAGMRIPASFGGYKRNLGAYARYFIWPGYSDSFSDWPSFLPPEI